MLPILACLIIVSPGTNGNWEEKYLHEVAHCNGWVHPHGVHGLRPPKAFLHNPKMPTEVKLVSLGEARRLCRGAMACQFFR